MVSSISSCEPSRLPLTVDLRADAGSGDAAADSCSGNAAADSFSKTGSELAPDGDRAGALDGDLDGKAALRADALELATAVAY